MMSMGQSAAVAANEVSFLPDRDRESVFSALRALGLVGTLGLVVAAGVVSGTLAGVWLDGALGTGGLLTAAGVLVGLAAGVYGAWRLIARDLPWNR